MKLVQKRNVEGAVAEVAAVEAVIAVAAAVGAVAVAIAGEYPIAISPKQIFR
jgi:hypothetical protein